MEVGGSNPPRGARFSVPVTRASYIEVVIVFEQKGYYFWLTWLVRRIVWRGRVMTYESIDPRMWGRSLGSKRKSPTSIMRSLLINNKNINYDGSKKSVPILEELVIIQSMLDKLSILVTPFSLPNAPYNETSEVESVMSPVLLEILRIRRRLQSIINNLE